MKKLILLVLAACSAIAPACTFLDIDPETGLDENQVFSTWDNFKAYFNNVYEGRTGQSGSGDNINIKLGYPLYLDFSDRRFTWNALTDMVRRRPLAPRTADQGRGAGRQRLRMDHRHVEASDLLLDVPHHPRGEQVHREYRHGAERQADRQGRPDRTSLFRAGRSPTSPSAGSSAACPTSTRRSKPTTNGT